MSVEPEIFYETDKPCEISGLCMVWVKHVFFWDATARNMQEEIKP
jgi:hypothetical protein